MNWNLSGYKTYIAAAGLFGLAIYQASVGQFEAAVQTGMAALGLLGMRHAVAKSAPMPLKQAEFTLKSYDVSFPLQPPAPVQFPGPE